jgi:hypothetical protein
MVGRAVGDVIPELSVGQLALWSRARSPTLEHDPDRVFIGVRKDGASIPVQVGHSHTLAAGSPFGLLSIADASELLELKQRLTAATEAHLAFQGLVAISRSSWRGPRLPTQRSDHEQPASLAEALQLDRAILWQKNGGARSRPPRTTGPTAQSSDVCRVASIRDPKLQAEKRWFSRGAELPIRSIAERSEAVTLAAAAGVQAEIRERCGAHLRLDEREYEGFLPSSTACAAAGVLSQALALASEASLATAWRAAQPRPAAEAPGETVAGEAGENCG